MNNIEKTTKLQNRRRELESLGQNENGKKNARDRIRLLFDEGSFIEIAAFVSSEVGADAEGVITGYGTVDGRLVYSYAQDFCALGGAVGAASAKKISNILDMAAKMGAPVVSILDSNGARINEGVSALAGIGEVLSKSAGLSGVVPQVAVVLGPCAGGAVFTAGLSDFVFMTEKNSSIFMTGPAVTSGITGKETDADSLGGAKVCSSNGIADFSFANEDDCIAGVKKLLNFLPSNNLEITPAYMPNDEINRISQNISALIPEDNMAYDVVGLIKEVVDNSDFFEVASEYAKNIVTGFASLNGMSVGIVANQTAVNFGALDISASKKAAKFIRTCDSYNIPIVTFVDVPGFIAGAEQEHNGISVYSASMLYAYAEATVPKVNVVVRKAYGSAYLAMGAKSIGADLVLAYPTAEISIMSPDSAANIIYKDDIAAAADPIAERINKISEYADNVASPYVAANNGFVDDIIEPDSTRPRLISALDMLASKREDKIAKKHGNMPV